MESRHFVMLFSGASSEHETILVKWQHVPEAPNTDLPAYSIDASEGAD